MIDKRQSSKQNLAISDNPTIKLIWGTLGIYFCFFSVSLLDQKMYVITKCRFKNHYQSFANPEQSQLFQYPILLVTMQNLSGYLISKLFNMANESKEHVPFTYYLKAGLLSVTSNITFNMGMIYTSLPLALLFRSCNLLSVILVGVCCSKVQA